MALHSVLYYSSKIVSYTRVSFRSEACINYNLLIQLKQQYALKHIFEKDVYFIKDFTENVDICF
jgi:hypothetical protein